MQTDYYAEADSIAQALERQGRIAESKSLRDAIECGSTASEILMALRWQLAELMDGEVATDAFIAARIHRLMAELDKELS